MAVASASSPSEDASQFHSIVDHMVFALNLPTEEISHLVFNVHGATVKSRLLQSVKSNSLVVAAAHRARSA